MARSKENKGGKQKSGDKYRKETKEEKRERLGKQAESREECLKLLPYAGGAILFFVVVFAIWVRSLPPKPVAQVVDPLSLNQGGGGTPEFEFTTVDTEPKMKEGLNEAMENAETETAAEEATPESETGADTAEESIEL